MVNLIKISIVFLSLKFVFLSTEAWSILLVLLTQDIPYFIVRSIIISQCGILVNGSMCFFFLKNIFMIMIDFYKFKVCYLEYKEMKEPI